ncbi:MAG: TPM domain-containing protein [Rhodospirillales bacterium]|nr:TPM domain-containing protein [Rhodospirillales bacterium]
MAFLDDIDRSRIEAAVAKAEQRTAAELVTVIARECGDYLFLPTLIAAVATLLLSGIALLIPWPLHITVAEFYVGQVLGFIVLYLILAWRPLRHRLVPRAIQRRRAGIRAHQMFLDLGMASTRHRTGVMFFVSACEHYAEIITDRGVRDVVPDEVWTDIVARFGNAVRERRIADGFVEAITTCTEVLAERLPRLPDDQNELPNRTVEL